MALSYRIGKFGWKLAARLGFSLRLHVSVLFDEESKMFVATSDDFLPLAVFSCEAQTPEALEVEIKNTALDILDTIFALDSKAKEPEIIADASFAF